MNHSISQVKLPELNIRKNKDHLLVYCFLFLLPFALYWKAIGYEFITYDDPHEILNNSHINKGFSWQGLFWCFTTFHEGNWHPLTLISEMLCCEWFGLNPAGHHLVNILLHVVNVLLLFRLLKHITKAFWKSACVAAIFAVHPLHIESVAWIVERKDVLSSFFLMISLLYYSKYAESGEKKHYVASLVLFVMTLMAKPMAITLPLRLLLLDWWPLGRLNPKDFTAKNFHITVWPLLREKIPFLFFSIISCILTLLAAQAENAIVPLEKISIVERLNTVVTSCTAYLDKAFWPTKLAILYPFAHDISPGKTFFSILLLTSITYLVFYFRKQRFLLTGWFWFLIGLLPVSGIVQAGSQFIADRYTYTPLLGIYIMVVWSSALLFRKLKWPPSFRPAIASIVIGALFITSFQHLNVWKNSVSLFSSAVRNAPNAIPSYCNLGTAYKEKGNFNEAMHWFQESLKLNPNDIGTLASIGNLYFLKGDYKTSLPYFQQCYKIDPSNFGNCYSYASALLFSGDAKNAILYYEKALKKEPKHPACLQNLAAAYIRNENPEQALQISRRLFDVNPLNSDNLNRIAFIYGKKGNIAKAEEFFERALQANPKNIRIHMRYGSFLSFQKKYTDALIHYHRALEISSQVPQESISENSKQKKLFYTTRSDIPSIHLEIGRTMEKLKDYKNALVHYLQALPENEKNTDLLNRIARAYGETGDMEKTVEYYTKSLELDPKQPSSLNNLAWIYATSPNPEFQDGSKAIILAKQAVTLSNESPETLDTLAASYAREGSFEMALKTLELAIQKAKHVGNVELASFMEQEKENYTRHKPIISGTKDKP